MSVFPSYPVGHQLTLDLFQHYPVSIHGVRFNILFLHILPQGHLIRDNQPDRVRGLIIIQYTGIYIFRLFGNSFLDPFRAVFLPVIRDQQGLETSQHVQPAIRMQISQITGMQPTVHDRLGRTFLVSPVTGHHVSSSYPQLSFLSLR